MLFISSKIQIKCYFVPILFYQERQDLLTHLTFLTKKHPASIFANQVFLFLYFAKSEHQVPTLGLRIFSPPLYQLSYVPMLHRKTLCDTVLLSQSWDMRFLFHQVRGRCKETAKQTLTQISHRAMTPGSRTTRGG